MPDEVIPYKISPCHCKPGLFTMSSNSAKTPLTQLILIAITAIALMSIVPVLIKWISANAATIGIIRLAIGAFGIGLVVITTQKRLTITKQEFAWLLLLGLVFAIHWYSYFVSIKMSDASLAAIGVATFGIHLLILSSIFNRDRFKLLDFFAVIISLTGIYLASPELDIEQDKLQGFLLSIVSGFLYACLPIINQRIPGLPTNTRALGQFSFALLAFLFLLPQADFNLSIKDWQGLIILGVVSTLIAHTLWIKASTELPANFTAIIYYGYVPASMILSAIFLDEEMTWHKIAGAILIIGANIMVIVFHKVSARTK